MLQAAVYIGDYDNTIDIELREQDIALTIAQTSAITRVLLRLAGGSVIDSDTSPPGAISWSGSGQLTLRLGGTLTMPTTGVPLTATLVVHSVDHPNGIVWGCIELYPQQV